MKAGESPQAAEWRAWLAVVFGPYQTPARLRRIASRMVDAGNREAALRYVRGLR